MSTPSTVSNYAAPPHPYSQPSPQQHLVPVHSRRDRDTDRSREREDCERQFAADPRCSTQVTLSSLSCIHGNVYGVLKVTNIRMAGPGFIPADERIRTCKESQCEREREEARVNHGEREMEREHEREQREREGLDYERNLQPTQQQQQSGGSAP